MIEIMFRGRGGQGAVVASEILGRAFFLEGKYPQSFAIFGAERRGAPVFAFLRVDIEPILLKCQIKHPNQLNLMDISLVEQKDVVNEVLPGGTILINTNHEIEYFKELQCFNLGLVDAALIARNLGLGGNFNTAMLGAYVRLTNLINLETLIKVVNTMVPSKKEENIEAVKSAYKEAKIYGAQP